MAKRSSWGATQEAYENSPLCAERRKNAELVGTLHRVAGHLGVVASVDAVSDWCAKVEKEKREENTIRRGSASESSGETVGPDHSHEG